MSVQSRAAQDTEGAVLDLLDERLDVLRLIVQRDDDAQVHGGADG